MEKLLLGIDIGTSACKVAVFDLNGNVAAQSTKPYPVYYPAPGYVEQDPMEWWAGICDALREIFADSKISADRIAGIGIDGQSWSAIPVDKNGNILHNTPIWMDTRASGICAHTIGKIGAERIFEISGNSFEPTYSTPKMLWFKENKPDVYKNTFLFLQSNSYIGYKLTGKFTQDVSQGYGIHAFNMKTGAYDDKFCEELGIDREKLPEIYACHDVIGAVTNEAALATGLSPGTPVVAGGLDASCGTLGAGVVDVGQTQEQGGQAGGMSICLDEAIGHPKLILGFHVIPKMWLLQGGTVGGGSFNWFWQELAGYESIREKETGVNAFKIMDDEAAAITPGSEGLVFLPYMSGERSPIWDKDAQGVFYGIGFNKTRAHMIRSVLEGCAYALLHNLKTAEEAGVCVETLNAMGGAANSRLWTQIKSDVTGKKINVPASDTATTLGAAILAGIGAGLYKDFNEAVGKTIEITRTHEPDMKNHEIYSKYFDIYLEIYNNLKSTMKKSSALNMHTAGSVK